MIVRDRALLVLLVLLVGFLGAVTTCRAESDASDAAGSGSGSGEALAEWVATHVRTTKDLDLRVAVREVAADSHGKAVLVAGGDVQGSRYSKGRARKTSRKGAAQLSIGKNMILCEETAFKDPVLGRIMRKYPDVFVGSTVLATFIVFEFLKGAESRWHPYLSALPDANNPFAPPLLWEPEGADRAMLTGSWILDRTLADEQGIASDYGVVTEVLFSKHADVFDPERFTLDLYLWAWSTLWSRGYWFDELGQSVVAGLDLCTLGANFEDDARKPQNVIAFRKGRAVLELKESAKTGSVIPCAVPHNRARNDFFRLHGYVLDGDSPNMRTMAFLRDSHISDDDPQSAIKHAILYKQEMDTPLYPYSDAPDGLYVTRQGVPDHVVGYFRAKHWKASRAQMEAFDQDETVPKVNPKKKINTPNEEAATQDIVDKIEATVNAYPESFEDDEKLLKSKDLTQRQRSAITVRLEEKNVLNQAHQAMIRPAQMANNAAEAASRKAESDGKAAAKPTDSQKYWFDEADEDTFWEEDNDDDFY